MSQQGVFKRNSDIVQIPGYIKPEGNNSFYLVCRSGKRYEIQFDDPMLKDLKKYSGNNVFLGGTISDDKMSVSLSYLRQDDRFRNHINNNFTPIVSKDESLDDDFDPVEEELPKKSKTKTAS